MIWTYVYNVEDVVSLYIVFRNLIALVLLGYVWLMKAINVP